MKKYIVYPTRVTSKNDRQRHFISFNQLCRLYKVDPKECVDATRRQDILGLRIDEFIPLHVSYFGNYKPVP